MLSPKVMRAGTGDKDFFYLALDGSIYAVFYRSSWYWQKDILIKNNRKGKHTKRVRRSIFISEQTSNFTYVTWN